MEGQPPTSQEQLPTSQEQLPTSQEPLPTSRAGQLPTSQEQPSTSQEQLSGSPTAGPSNCQGLQALFSKRDLTWDARTLPHSDTLSEDGHLFCNHKLGDCDPGAPDPLRFPGAASAQWLDAQDTAYWQVEVRFERGRRRSQASPLCAVGVVTLGELATRSHGGALPRFDDGAFLVSLSADWDRKYLKLSARRGNKQLDPAVMEEPIETEKAFSTTLGFAFHGPQARVTVTQPRGRELGVAWATDWGVGERCRVFVYAPDRESCDEVIEVRLLPASQLQLQEAQLQQLAAIFQ